MGSDSDLPVVGKAIDKLGDFGVPVEVEHAFVSDTEVTCYRLDGSAYRTPGEVSVEGDWSNAAFWLCAGAMGTEPITVTGLSLSSAQGDRTVMAALSRFGARMRRGTGSATAQPDHLNAFTLSAQDVPDLVPILAAAASVAHGRTIIQDCRRLRLKESDRLATTAGELTALGAQVRVADDDLLIRGVEALSGGAVEAHNDHRIVMAMAVLLTQTGGVIQDAQVVRKSMPDFFARLEALGITVEHTFTDT